MATTSPAEIADFLSCRRVALIGVSRNKKDFSRLLMQAMVAYGYDIVPVNPGAKEIEGRTAYAEVGQISPPVEGALLMTPRAQVEPVVRACIAAGVPRIWLHRGVGQGAVDDKAVDLCRLAQVPLVAGACPLMFIEGAQRLHKVHGTMQRWSGSYPCAQDKAPGLLRGVLSAVHGLVALSAIAAGASLIQDPTGSGMGVTTALLAGSPFQDYLWPGLALALVIGGSMGLAAVGQARGTPLAWLYSLVAGTVLCGWIMVQVGFIGYVSFMQPLLLAVGAGLVAVAVRSVRRMRPPVQAHPRLAII